MVRESIRRVSQSGQGLDLEFRIPFGIGIDLQVLQRGRDDHWGLQGMRERADKIAGKLKIWSNGTNGTEVEIRVPGRIAFEISKLK